MRLSSLRSHPGPSYEMVSIHICPGGRGDLPSSPIFSSLSRAVLDACLSPTFYGAFESLHHSIFFFGFGSYVGVWQFYVVQPWLYIQHTTPLITALYLLPNAIMGALATWMISKTLHTSPGSIFMQHPYLAFALGPVFFLSQTSGTPYWALLSPGVLLVTFDPDSAFVAASIFINGNVPQSYQSSAGSLLVTVRTCRVLS